MPLDATNVQTSEALPDFGAFGAPTLAQWRDLAIAAFKGGAFERLESRSAEGLPIKPLYPRPATPQTAPLLAPKPGWTLAQRVDQPEPDAARIQALGDLEAGAEALTLVMAEAPGAHGFGLEAELPEDVAAALAGVEADLISLRLDAPGSGLAAARRLGAGLALRGFQISGLRVDFCCNPLGARMRGTANALDDMPEICALARSLSEAPSPSRALGIDGRILHDAGAGEAQELAFMLAGGLYYLKALNQSGLSLEDARNQISFIMAADADQFLTMAKFRALRLLWARLEEACGLSAQPLRLHAESAWRMMTREDPHVNIMRVGMAVFAAGVSGADVITALPYSMALGLPDGFARRVARNTQLILRAESHLGIVADPAAGSGAIEALTDELCRAAWAQFQTIEAEGGIVQALTSGSLAAAVSATAKKRAQAIATRRQPLTGTSAFASLQPVRVTCLAPAPERPEAGGDFPAMRLSEPFEKLRARARALPAAQVVLATLGPLADHAARATFAAQFFASGGIAIARTSPCDELESATDTTRWACLCATDKAYAAEGAAALARLQALGYRIALAGQPGAHEATFRAAGAEIFIFSGGDAVATLGTLLDTMTQDMKA
ncbi:MAG: methylmalonyl-CoA mutase subunit beta [Hyphomicrobiales bacterium]|nr:methylmalonyl-CoA mutase subunit beta [Hyphomicrobiales bacterium]